jgi:peptidoglycan/xylan/chitin deacetylase (PgdA/CDA1 family)
MAEAIRLHTEVVGERPRGWYTGRCRCTRCGWRRGGRLSPMSPTAMPTICPTGCSFRGRDQLIVPYTLDANDMRFATPQGFNSGDQFCAYLTDSFDCALCRGAAGAPKMMSIGLHCRLVGRPGRAAALKRALDTCRP